MAAPGSVTRPGRVAITVAVALLAFTMAGLLSVVRASRETSAGQAALAPAWQDGAVACRPDPLRRVHDASRLVLVARCSTASGIVTVVNTNPVDKDVVLLVAVDPAYRRFLAPSNNGLLGVNLVPPDLPDLEVPKAGDHATFYGAWVLDKNRGRSARIHPAYHVQTTQWGPGSGPEAVDAAMALTLDLNVEAAVRAGQPITLRVAAWTQEEDGRDTSPAPNVQLYLEIISENGGLVRWKGATTNSLGTARVAVPAIDREGRYRLHVYGRSGAQTATNQAAFVVQPP